MSTSTIPPIDSHTHEDAISEQRQRILALDADIAHARDAVAEATARLDALILERDRSIWRLAQSTATGCEE